MRRAVDLEKLCRRVGVVPVVTVASAEQSVPLAEALLAGGLPCIEITFRSDAAAEAIELVRRLVPAATVGAGTTLPPAQADAAIGAGAAFLVGPGFNPTVVDHVLDRGVQMMPGIATPSELEQAMARGLRLVKVFPAGPLGGPAYLRALSGPYRAISFVPTGGVSPDNLADYLALPSVAAAGGTWLAKAEVVAAAQWGVIEQLAAEAVAIVRRVRPKDEAGAVGEHASTGSRAKP
jgi:2-dehydro-3-deoxyphosphogluconate aldolase / (4S)-4-hydroxy-2-oxoglutarate aldolase